MDIHRLLVLAAFALVACGSAAPGFESRAVPPPFLVVRDPVGSGLGSDAQRIREGLPRGHAGGFSDARRACSLRRGAAC